MKRYPIYLLALMLAACAAAPNLPAALPPVTPILIQPSEAPTQTLVPSETAAPSLTPTLLPTETNTPTLVPVVESLDAVVTAERLSCRYGPGAEYLYLYGLKKGANIKLIGRADGNNWVMVAGKSLCWVNAKYLEIKGDRLTLKATYPEDYRLPVSPYYAAPIVLSATRSGNSVTVSWGEIALRPGDEEDENMFIYIIEVWRCENGTLIFDPLASNYPEVTFVDEAGCAAPSHGRVFFQEKHGFAGPSEIPFP
ncbi:MAG: hypothetical protein PHQ36_09540 [Anaerolineales bacterium]|nr:hypothetical protein [Anaerolineales bacterium]